MIVRRAATVSILERLRTPATSRRWVTPPIRRGLAHLALAHLALAKGTCRRSQMIRTHPPSIRNGHCNFSATNWIASTAIALGAVAPRPTN